MTNYMLEIPALNDNEGPGAWYDADDIVFHAVFTCLVNFVEKEHDGPDGYRDYVQWCCDEDVNHPEIQKKTLELYDWYRATNWDNESPDLYSLLDTGTGAGKSPHDLLKEAVEVIGVWWT